MTPNPAIVENYTQIKDRLDGVYGALADAETVVVWIDDPGKSVRELIAQRDEALSRLAEFEPKGREKLMAENT